MNERTPEKPGTEAWEELSPIATGIRGNCPRCGLGQLFDGFLKVRDHCDVCGLDYRFADPADGPAVFVQLFMSFPVVIFVVVLQIVFSPPLLLLIVLALPMLVLTIIMPLRPIKGVLIATQYIQNAQEAGSERQWDQLHQRRAEKKSAK